jgi:hypothetical protein
VVVVVNNMPSTMSIRLLTLPATPFSIQITTQTQTIQHPMPISHFSTNKHLAMLGGTANLSFYSKAL